MIRDKHGRPRYWRPRPVKTPWPRVPRVPIGRDMTSCDSKRHFGNPTLSAQESAAWAKKNCSPRRTAREFRTGGLEAGTLVGARRAPGLFDENWGTDFPLTRREQKTLQEGAEVPDPFFQPPTYAYAGNWIADKLELLRKKLAGSPYTSALNLNPLCGPRGSMTSCSTPSGTVSWVSTTDVISKADNARFAAAYCQPGCQTGGKASPPPGFTERVITAQPRNPAVRLSFTCGPAPAEAPRVGPQLPPIPTGQQGPPNPPPPPPPPGCLTSSTCGAFTICWDHQPSFAEQIAWTVAHCGPFVGGGP